MSEVIQLKEEELRFESRSPCCLSNHICYAKHYAKHYAKTHTNCSLTLSLPWELDTIIIPTLQMNKLRLRETSESMLCGVFHHHSVAAGHAVGCLRRGGTLGHSVGSQRSSLSAPMPAVHSVILVFLEPDALIKILFASSSSTGFLKE